MIAATSRVGRSGWLRPAGQPIRSTLPPMSTLALVAILLRALEVGVTAASPADDGEQAQRLVDGMMADELTAPPRRERVALGSVFAQPNRSAANEAHRARAEATHAGAARFFDGRKDVGVPAGLAAPSQRLASPLAVLPVLRDQVRGGRDATGSVTIVWYRALTADRSGSRTALSRLGAAAKTADGLRASAAVSQAIEAVGLRRAAVPPAIGATSSTAAEQLQIVEANAMVDEALGALRQVATARWQAQLAEPSSRKAALAGERLQAIAARARADGPQGMGTDVATRVAAASARVARLDGAGHGFNTASMALVIGQADGPRRDLYVPNRPACSPGRPVITASTLSAFEGTGRA